MTALTKYREIKLPANALGLDGFQTEFLTTSSSDKTNFNRINNLLCMNASGDAE